MSFNGNKIKNIFRKSVSIVLCALMVFGIFSSESLLTVINAALSSGSSAQPNVSDTRATLSFNENWRFALGDFTGAGAKAFDDSSWSTVSLPHDYSISQDFTNTDTEVESGNLPGGVGWYRKMFTMPAEYATKEVFVTFDGVYNNAYVYVNGKLIAENHYGYNSFTVSIGDYITCNGSTWNVIAVKTDSETASSRWYPGAGIYRDVTITIAETLHVADNGTYITTPTVSDSSATVNAAITVSNDSNDKKTAKVVTSVLSPDGREVASAESSVTVNAKSSAELNETYTVPSPSLWDIDSPDLYTLRTLVYDDTVTLTDQYDSTFGIRTVEWNADTGFYLNGKSVKIKGMCMHHDQGALGAVQEYDALYRQLSIVKSMGCNAVRTSHNSPSKVFIEICERLGLLVMEEFFDDWTSPKSGNVNDFSKYFSKTISSDNKLYGAETDMTWAQFVIKQTMLRDRNSPAVIIWSIGNELYQATDKTGYAETAKKLVDCVKEYDTTRPVTEGNDQSKILNIDEYVDVIGANYHPDAWVTLKNNGAFTGKAFIATESASAITSRGVYSYSSTRQGGQVGKIANSLYSYDNSKVNWGTTAATAWYYAAANDWFSGEFVWTGFDYIGEPTPWFSSGTGSSTVPNSSYFGVIDTAGFAKDQYYLYRSWWNENDTTLHLLPGTWNKDNLYVKDGFVYVNVYSNADHIELLLNGKVIGTAQSTDITTENGYTYKTWAETSADSSVCRLDEIFNGTGHDLYSQFFVKYEEGTLSVKAYDAAGKEITDTVGTKSVTSGKPAVKIVSKVWGEDDFTADSHSYAYVEFEAVDEDGNFVNDCYDTLNISVNNDGVIVGVDNGFQGTTKKFQNSSALLSDTSATVDLFGGRALAIIKTTNVSNNVQVTATTDGGLTVEGSTFTAREQTAAEKNKIFENYVLQSVVEYTPTVYDRYEMLLEEISEIAPSEGVDYTYYPVTDAASTGDGLIPTGDYIITGISDNPNVVAAAGAANYQVYSSGSTHGIRSTGVQGTPAATDPTWHFEKLDNNKYYVYYTDDSGVKHYMTLGSSAGSLTLSETPYEVFVTLNSDGVYIHNDTQYVNYYGSTNPKNVVSTWSTGTALTLYTTDGTTVTQWVNPNSTVDIPDGKYALVNSDKVISNTYNSSNRLSVYDANVNGTVLTLTDDDYFTFERVGSTSTFTIKTADGKYVNFGSTDDSISLSDTAQAFNILLNGDGSISIYTDGGQFLDYFRKENMISTWTGETTNVTSNRKVKLYKRPDNIGSVDPADYELYQALLKAEKYKPGEYSTTSYDAFINAAENGIKVYKNTSSTSDMKYAAAEAINAAISKLEAAVKKFPARIIKYGYSPNSTNPYSGGGYDFNNQTYAEMESAIRANDDVLSQIKTIIDYDGTNGTVWSDGYADKALDSAISEYAKIYSLAFRDSSVTGGYFVDNFRMSAWNHWQKSNTQGASEKQDEGVSLQGIYSKTLGADGYPVSHTPYTVDGGLTYLGGHTKTGLLENISLELQTGASSTTSVTLTPLNNISVYVPDFFSPTNVKGTYNEYSKFYWNTEFPFFLTTDSEGVNHYVYDSSDDTHMLRASYDDKTQTAVVDFYNESEWDVNRPYAGKGKGFFPFNYQTGESEYTDDCTGENGIYHFGMTFDMDFYIPKGGKVSKTSEDYEFFFSGDDDVLVYVDDVLILDNGGLHGARTCSINFSEASVSYQYAMNVADGKLVSEVENDVEYIYGQDYDEISDVNKTAIEYLNKIRNDGERHTFSFFYLERGSTESNCKITFNLQQVSEHIGLNDQTLVADYGLPIRYDVKDNNTMTETAVNNGATVEYIGITNEIEKAISFTKPSDFDPIERAQPLKHSGEYGNYTVTSDGIVTYEPTSMEFSGSDSFYLCAEVTNDPTYSNGTVYYAFEKVTFVPAANIYYEENFFEDYTGGISYTDGTTAAGFDNTDAKHGEWTEVTGGKTSAYQAADLVGDSAANVYGYDPAYDDSEVFSNGTARKVTVSTKNNPNSYYSGGTGGTWPKVRFSFTGTGFDLLSVTDSTTGIFTVDVYAGTDTTKTPVRRHIVDTYYGYSYVRLYADSNGDMTSSVTDTPLYWTKNNRTTVSPTYYGEDGVITRDKHYYKAGGVGYTETPTYYAADGSITETVTDTPAYSYAYAYGWIKDENSTTDSLYQIPVISVEGLDYGEYTAVVTAKFSSLYNHYNETEINGETVKSYDLYIDGIRIYDPAGEGNGITEKVIAESYKKDGEAYPNYIELRNMLIGADSFGESETEHGVIFIDGIPALDNDIEKYKVAGPNNELYLCSGQAVAFEIWATSVPTDLQLFAKTAKGTPTLRVTYNGLDVEKTIGSATQMSYSFNSLLPVSHKLVWTQVTVGGKAYYTTGTIVIANSSEQDSILSLGRLKWTFDIYGAKGFYRIPTQSQSEELTLMSTAATYSTACKVVSSLNTETAIKQKNVSAPATVTVGDSATVTVKTSDDVKALIIKDADGNSVAPTSLLSTTSDGETVWRIQLTPEKAGADTYTVTGVNVYGAEGKSGAVFTVNAENGGDNNDPEDNMSFLDRLIDFFRRIINFLKKLFG